MRTILAILCAMLVVTAGKSFAAQDVKLLNDFETDEEMKIWETEAGAVSLSDQHVTHGKKSMKVEPGKTIKISRPQDWSGYEALEMDCFVDGDAPVSVAVIIFDKACEAKRSYWNWHNGFQTLPAGQSTLTLPVDGLFRGEKNAANRDIPTNINPREITVFHLGFTPTGKCSGVYLDNMRLTKETLPEGIQAFAFGPAQQAVFPGFKPITYNTIYGQGGKTAGLKMACSPNRARDDAFPTRLYQHFVWFQEGGNEFIADVPNGKCHVWMAFADCGYWNGEQARFHKRTVTANGKEVYADDRGENGPCDYMFHFENTEPKVGDSLWDMYVKEMFKPVKFEVDVTDGKLHIQCAADGNWNTKVAAIVVYPDTKKTEADAWLTEVDQRNKKDFESRAVYVGAKPKALDVPADAKAKGYWLGFPSIEENIISIDAPGKSDGKLARSTAKGQRIGFTFAIRTLKDFDGTVTLTASDLKGPDTIPGSSIDLRWVHQLTHRASDSSYTIEPVSLAKVEGANLKLTKDFTRQFWVTVPVPAEAKAGTYTGSVTLAAGSLKVSLPVSLEVLDVTLDEPDFSFGFFGASVPDDLPAARKKTAWLDLLTLLKQYGMNSLSGGPAIQFSGLDSTGKPQLNFAACDEYFKVLKQAGFSKAIYTYGGPAYVEGLHDGGYVIGNTGHGWEKKTGKPFKEILQIVFSAVKEHAQKEGWPPINYSLLDEPRMLEGTLANLELHKAYHDAAANYTGGFYSVNWKNSDPFSKAVQDIFKNMAWSGLNEHSQIDFDKAKEFGRDIHIYNNGSTRFSFGAYQWAEMHKGVKGRLEWHTLNLAGFQFFDLDGQEPDFGIINWGRNEIIPAVALARCSEGAADFRLAVTLWNLAEKKKGTPEAKAAQDYLEEVNKIVGAGKHEAPAGFSDETFHNTCIEHLKKLIK